MGSNLKNRFRGAIVGALVGDCLGAYWERQSWKGSHPLDEVKKKIQTQIQEAKSGKGPLISYTDDTALTLALGDSLMECGKFSPTHFARKITKVYYDDPRRGYGRSVSTIFYKLKTTKDSDIFLPAREQFDGQGSCGNGAAMRISPAALCGFKDDKLLIQICTESSKVTHFHPSGINNAMLQAIAIKFALQAEMDQLNPADFIKKLSEFIQPFEPVDQLEAKDQDAREKMSDNTLLLKASKVRINYFKGQPTCSSRLHQIQELLLEKEPPSAYSVQELLGHGVLAGETVPCAIYAFLSHADKSFQELVPYAISLGGDTDTIASMAGAIGGAYFGYDKIPQDWIDCCEEVARACSLADSIYEKII